MQIATSEIDGRTVSFDLSPGAAVDLCIPFDPSAPDTARPSCFYLPSPSVVPASSGSWVGAVSAGSSVNCPVVHQSPSPTGCCCSAVCPAAPPCALTCSPWWCLHRSYRCVHTPAERTQSVSAICCHTRLLWRMCTSSYVFFCCRGVCVKGPQPNVHVFLQPRTPIPCRSPLCICVVLSVEPVAFGDSGDRYPTGEPSDRVLRCVLTHQLGALV